MYTYMCMSHLKMQKIHQGSNSDNNIYNLNFYRAMNFTEIECICVLDSQDRKIVLCFESALSMNNIGVFFSICQES